MCVFEEFYNVGGYCTGQDFMIPWINRMNESAPNLCSRRRTDDFRFGRALFERCIIFSASVVSVLQYGTVLLVFALSLSQLSSLIECKVRYRKLLSSIYIRMKTTILLLYAVATTLTLWYKLTLTRKTPQESKVQYCTIRETTTVTTSSNTTRYHE